MQMLSESDMDTIQEIIRKYKKTVKCDDCAYDKWKDCPCYLLNRLRVMHEEVEEWLR